MRRTIPDTEKPVCVLKKPFFVLKENPLENEISWRAKARKLLKTPLPLRPPALRQDS